MRNVVLVALLPVASACSSSFSPPRDQAEIQRVVLDRLVTEYAAVNGMRVLVERKVPEPTPTRACTGREPLRYRVARALDRAGLSVDEDPGTRSIGFEAEQNRGFPAGGDVMLDVSDQSQAAFEEGIDLARR